MFAPLTRPYLPAHRASLTLSRPRETQHGPRPRRPPRLRAGLRRADPLHAAHARLLRGDRLHHAVSLGALHRRAVHRRCASRSPGARRPSSPPPRRTSPARATRGRARRTMAAPSSTQVYSGDTSHDARPAHLAYRLRPRPHHGDGQRHLVPAAGVAPRGRRRAHRRAWRRGFTARPPTAAIASRSKPMRRKSCAAAARMAPTPRSWCRTARSATRPAAWSRAIWRRTASPPW